VVPLREAARADVDRVVGAEEAAVGVRSSRARELKNVFDPADPANPTLPMNLAPRSLALKEGEWKRVVERMHQDALAAQDQRAEAEKERAAKRTRSINVGEASKEEEQAKTSRRSGRNFEEEEEQRAEAGAVEPITALTDGASEQKELGCSGKDEDCSKTRCCTAEGHQCYEKDEYFATCRPICFNTSTWSCAELGERTPLENPGSCSAPGEECLFTRCCTEPGMRCYSMDENAYWSSCAYDCKPGVGWAENWTCGEIGERAPDPLGCSWSGEACIANKLCCHEGQSCVRKNDIEAYCTHEDVPEDWDGEVLGGARYEYPVTPVAPEEARGTSLYCFMAVLPGSYEEQLKDLAAEMGASIFACDASSVFSAWQAETTEEGSWTSVINTEVFKSVWAEVNKDAQYQGYDWSVKVDPDSVFFPDRLKVRLQSLNAPKDIPIYIKNTDMGFGFFGAIEVFTKEALDKLFWDGILDKCEQEVGTHSGEDGYIKGCMDMLGAGAMEDLDVLRTPSADSCDDPDRVCFHAFKDAAAWEGCYNQALA